MTWLPGLNNCKYSEDVTTAAVYKIVGLQNPTLAQVNPGLQAQQHPVGPPLAAPSGLIPDHKIQDPKPAKVNRSGSKEGMGKKVAAGTVKNSTSSVKRMEANTGKSRSLNDVGQPLVDQLSDRPGLETSAAEHGGYGQQVPVDIVRKVKQKEKPVPRMWTNIGEELDPRREERNRNAMGSYAVPHDVGKAVKLPVTVEVDNGGEGNAWVEPLDPKPSKQQQKGKLLQNGSTLDNAGVNVTQNRRAGEGTVARRAQACEEHGLARICAIDKRAKERESGDRARVNSRNAGWGTTSEQPLKKVKTQPFYREEDFVFRSMDGPDLRREGRGTWDDDSTRDSYENLASTDSEKDESHSEHAGPQKGGLQRRSPPSSSSKVSYSGASSAFGSKGGSPLEATVSSTPVRSSKVDGAATGCSVGGGVLNNHNTSQSLLSQKLNSISPSPKSSLDRDADAHSDREGALHYREWEEPPSSDHEREFRGGGRDPRRENGRGRDDRCATGSSREGAGGFPKFIRIRPPMKDSERFWDEGREARAGSASHFLDWDYRHRDDHYLPKFTRIRPPMKDSERFWDEGREARAGRASHFLDWDYTHRDDHYRAREDSVDRYGNRDRYERRGSRRYDRFRERDRERDRERYRSRESWAPDRSGDSRDKRHSRERSVRQDRGAKPSSRESVLDKQGTWHDEPRPSKDVGRDGRDRVEEDNAKIKHVIRSSHFQEMKEDHLGEDEHVAPELQKDDPSHRFEKNDLGPPKDAKSNHVRALIPGQVSLVWEGDKVGASFFGRKEPDTSAPRSGSEAQAMATHVNSRNRLDITQSGPGSIGVRGKAGQADSAAHNGRNFEDAKHGKEHKRGSEESSHLTRGAEGASSSLSKKEHAALGKALSEEARQLKHSADRLKNVASMEDDIPNLYLQASLKFLQSAHHFEMASAVGDDGVPHGHPGQAIQLYNETACFFDFCATLYEQQRDLAAAALAHICAAVARFRGFMGTSASLNKDCLDLQNAVSLAVAPGSQVAGIVTPPTGLPPPPPLALSRASEKPRPSHVVGESPSSSFASDVDNLNNHAVAGEKGLPATAMKGAALSPTLGSVSGSSTELVPHRLQGSLTRVIRNGLDVFAMMESWTKAQNATSAAEAACAGVPLRQEGMAAVRKILEIGNMDAVVRQARLALEAIGH